MLLTRDYSAWSSSFVLSLFFNGVLPEFRDFSKQMYSLLFPYFRSSFSKNVSLRWLHKEDVVYIYNRIPLSQQKRWIPTTYIDTDGTGGYDAELNKSIRGQSSYSLTHIVKGIIRERRENEWGKIREEDKPWEIPNSGKLTKGCGRGRGWWDGVTGWQALRRAVDGMSTGCYMLANGIKIKN